MVIVETPFFTRRLLDLLDDEEYRRLQLTLVNRPDAGALIPGGSGLRKIRWVQQGKGKRGGVRLIYYWARPRQQLLMLYIYPKSEQDNLSPVQIKALRQAIEKEYP